MIYPQEILWDIGLSLEAVAEFEALSLQIHAISSKQAKERAQERYELEEKDIRDIKIASYDPPSIALSVRQPWAWAIIYAGKDIENRSSYAITKGEMEPKRIAIHAAQGVSQKDYENARLYMLEHCGIDCPAPDELLRGCIIGGVTVTRIVNDHASPWFMGPRGLVLRDPLPYRPKGKTTGKLSYFKWEESSEALPEPKPWMVKYSKSQKSPQEVLI